MEPIRLVCRRSKEVGSFKVRSHILPMCDPEHRRSPRPIVSIAKEARSRLESLSRRAKERVSCERLEETWMCVMRERKRGMKVVHHRAFIYYVV